MLYKFGYAYSSRIYRRLKQSYYRTNRPIENLPPRIILKQDDDSDHYYYRGCLK